MFSENASISGSLPVVQVGAGPYTIDARLVPIDCARWLHDRPDTGHCVVSEDDILTAHGAATIAGVNERTVRRAIASGTLVALKENGVYRIRGSDLTAWCNRSAPSSSSVNQSSPGIRTYPELQVPMSSFLGREQELHLASSLLAKRNVRLVTLTGPGGVGKTRLALAIAEKQRSRFRDGVVIVPLEHVSEPSQIPGVVLRSLGITAFSQHSPWQALQTTLRDSNLLLVLDNVEHLVSAAPQLAETLKCSTQVTLLVTSRKLLRVSSEHVVPVPSMGLPTSSEPTLLEAAERSLAVQLFVARASAISPEFSLDAGTAPAIVDICRRLDGLPLAIELAAARINYLPLSTLLARLDARLSVLTAGPRDTSIRSSTMENSIAWSYDLLTDDEQQVFRRLAIFAGGFTFPAVEYILGNDDSVSVGESSFPQQAAIGTISLDSALGSLIDSSLLRRVDIPKKESRFEMLETIRAFALNQLARDENESRVRDRHAIWFTTLAERLMDGWSMEQDDLWWLEAVEVEHDNVRAALSWLERSGNEIGLLRLAIAMHPFWEVRSFHEEAVDWTLRGLRSSATLTPELTLAAHALIGRKRQRQGQFESALFHNRNALQIAQKFGVEKAIADALIGIGKVETNRENYEEAVTILSDALERFEKLPNNAGVSTAHYFLTIALYGRSEYVKARRHMQAAMQALDTTGSTFNLSVMRNPLVHLCCDTGESEDAAIALGESLHAWSQSRGANLDILAECLVASARFAQLRDRPVLAAQLIGAAEGLTELVGIPLWVPPPSQYRRLFSGLQLELGKEMFADAVAHGRSTDIDRIVASAIDLASQQIGTRPEILTPRERDVLELLVEGLTDQEIASRLFLSVRTVEGHVANVLGKFNVSSRTSAVREAIVRGLITSPRQHSQGRGAATDT